MYKEQLEKNWDHWKEKIRQKWPKLTTDDMKEIHGSYDRLVHKLKARHNVSQQELERELGHFSAQTAPQGKGQPNKMRPGEEPHKNFNWGQNKPAEQQKHSRPNEQHGHKKENHEWDKKRKAG